MTNDQTSARHRTAAALLCLKSLGVLVFMLLFVSGCGKKDSDASGTIVKLLDAGAEPRTALRYKFQAGKTEKMIMDMSMAMAMSGGGMKQPETVMPTTRITMAVHSKEISPEGDLRYEFEVEEIDVLPQAGANSMMVNAMKQQMSSMEGMGGSATVSSRGLSRDIDIKVPPGVDPQIKQQMDSMEQSMGQMSASLPEEPVGKGARWKVTMPMDTPQMKLTQTATYVLSEIEGDKVKFDVTVTQSAPRQEVNAPGAPQGTKMFLESLKSSGKGTIEQEMTNLVPTSEMEMTATTIFSANKQKMETTMRIGLKIHP